VTQLLGGHPTICLAPFPASDEITINPFLQIRCGHRIGVDVRILAEKTCEGPSKLPQGSTKARIRSESPATNRTGAFV